MVLMSRPSSIKLNSRGPTSMVSFVFCGHLKRCFSSLFCQRQNPFRSQYNIFSIVLPRLQNTKRWPENGSRRRESSTRIDRLFIALRISVLPGARKTRTWDGRYIISAPVHGRHAQGLRNRILCRSRCDSVYQLQGKAVGRLTRLESSTVWAAPTRPGQAHRCVLFFFSSTGSSLN